MNWFALAILGYFLLSVVFILDKLILAKSVDKPVVYTFYSTIFMFGALFAWPFGVELLKTARDWIVAIASGIAFGSAMWTMFIAVKKSEASHINPFIGGVVTLVTYLLSSLFLGEALDSLQMWGVAILLLASVLFSFEKTKARPASFNNGYAWGVLAGVLFALSHIFAKYLYDLYPFVTAFVWTRVTTGFVGLFCLFFPSVRETLFSVNRGKKHESKKFTKRHATGIILGNKIMSVVAIVCIQYAIAIGSVTLVNALSGLQYAFMFALIYLLTKTAPKVFKEYFTASELCVQTISIALVLLGSALFAL